MGGDTPVAVGVTVLFFPVGYNGLPVSVGPAVPPEVVMVVVEESVGVQSGTGKVPFGA